MRYFILIIALILIGCSSKEAGTNEGKYGHWIFRGSSTFQQIFQCVDKFEPHQNKECK
jgi:hypothetical protein